MLQLAGLNASRPSSSAPYSRASRMTGAQATNRCLERKGLETFCEARVPPAKSGGTRATIFFSEENRGTVTKGASRDASCDHRAPTFRC